MKMPLDLTRRLEADLEDVAERVHLEFTEKEERPSDRDDDERLLARCVVVCCATRMVLSDELEAVLEGAPRSPKKKWDEKKWEDVCDDDDEEEDDWKTMVEA